MNAPSPFLQRRRRRMKTPTVDDIVDLETESPLHSTPGSSKRSAIDLDDDDFETGESSTSKSNDRILCEFCAAEKTSGEWFPFHGCSHRYCKDCAASYVASKLQKNVTAVIPCPAPSCGSGKLSPDNFRGILPADVFERWTLANDGGEEPVRETRCHRMLCARCGEKWQAGIGREEGETEDLMVTCPYCSSFNIERIGGCSSIKCRKGEISPSKGIEPAGSGLRYIADFKLGIGIFKRCVKKLQIRELGENILTVEAHQVRPLLYDDFRKSMAVIRASLNKSNWEELLKYNQEFGSN